MAPYIASSFFLKKKKIGCETETGVSLDNEGEHGISDVLRKGKHLHSADPYREVGRVALGRVRGDGDVRVKLGARIWRSSWKEERNITVNVEKEL